jgi:hypothetical protein
MTTNKMKTSTKAHNLITATIQRPFTHDDGKVVIKAELHSNDKVYVVDNTSTKQLLSNSMYNGTEDTVMAIGVIIIVQGVRSQHKLFKVLGLYEQSENLDLNGNNLISVTTFNAKKQTTRDYYYNWCADDDLIGICRANINLCNSVADDWKQERTFTKFWIDKEGNRIEMSSGIPRKEDIQSVYYKYY